MSSIKYKNIGSIRTLKRAVGVGGKGVIAGRGDGDWETGFRRRKRAGVFGGTRRRQRSGDRLSTGDSGRETDCQQGTAVGRPIVDGRVMAVKGGEIKEPGIFILALTCSEIRKKRLTV